MFHYENDQSNCDDLAVYHDIDYYQDKQEDNSGFEDQEQNQVAHQQRPETVEDN